MKKFIAILLIIATAVAVFIYLPNNNENNEELLAAVHEDLNGSMFKATFREKYSPVDTSYIATFTEDTVTYEIKRVNADYKRMTSYETYNYSLKMKDGKPYIKVHTSFFENLIVTIRDLELCEPGEKIIISLRGDDPDVGHFYSRSY